MDSKLPSPKVGQILRQTTLSSGVEIYHQGGYNFLIVQGATTRPVVLPTDGRYRDEAMVRELGLQDRPEKIFGIAIM